MLGILFIVMVAIARPDENMDSLLESHMWEQPVVIMLARDVEHPDLVKQRHSVALLDVARYEAVRYHYVKRNGAALPHIPAAQFFREFSDDGAAFMMIVMNKAGDVVGTSRQPLSAEKITALLADEG